MSLKHVLAAIVAAAGIGAANAQGTRPASTPTGPPSAGSCR